VRAGRHQSPAQRHAQRPVLGDLGRGVPWNESHYDNPEFDKALDEAGSLVDVNERRKVMAKVEKILQDDAIMVQPLWRGVFSATTDNVRGYTTHPTLYHQFNKVWMA
jgi:peptide/nickel transport system substrate-binding protein